MSAGLLKYRCNPLKRAQLDCRTIFSSKVLVALDYAWVSVDLISTISEWMEVLVCVYNARTKLWLKWSATKHAACCREIESAPERVHTSAYFIWCNFTTPSPYSLSQRNDSCACKTVLQRETRVTVSPLSSERRQKSVSHLTVTPIHILPISIQFQGSDSFDPYVILRRKMFNVRVLKELNR